MPFDVACAGSKLKFCSIGVQYNLASVILYFCARDSMYALWSNFIIYTGCPGTQGTYLYFIILKQNGVKNSNTKNL